MLLTLTACTPPRPLPHEAYVWQRQWDASLVDALRNSRGAIGGLRVLALQLDDRAQWIEAAVDLRALAGDPRGAVLVVRLEGAVPLADATDLVRRIDALRTRWRDSGVTVRGVELDHDCATARLPAYADLLDAVRPSIGADTPLTITALPDWLTSPELEHVLQRADGSVLQVHAVQAPTRGLFDARLAQQWIAAWSARSGTRPFAVALPAYGLRLHIEADGTLRTVESEQPLRRHTATVRDIGAEPVEVAGLLRRLERDPPPNLSGVIWFRLPRERDARAWSLATLHAVIRDEPLVPDVSAVTRESAQGAIDVALRSTGTLDAALPRSVRVDGPCAIGDGINGYRWRSHANGGVFERSDDGALKPGRRLAIGWLRCTGNVAVEPEA